MNITMRQASPLKFPYKKFMNGLYIGSPIFGFAWSKKTANEEAAIKLMKLDCLIFNCAVHIISPEAPITTNGFA